MWWTSILIIVSTTITGTSSTFILFFALIFRATEDEKKKNYSKKAINLFWCIIISIFIYKLLCKQLACIILYIAVHDVRSISIITKKNVLNRSRLALTLLMVYCLAHCTRHTYTPWKCAKNKFKDTLTYNHLKSIIIILKYFWAYICRKPRILWNGNRRVVSIDHCVYIVKFSIH